MGALGNALSAYMQPLIDQSDGTLEGLNQALKIGQLCYNLSLISEDQRTELLNNMQRTLEMNDADFEVFRQAIVLPMIRRHEEMFPGLHRRGPSTLGAAATSSWGRSEPEPTASPSFQPYARKTQPGETYPGTDRYAPCPCGSGEKYKFCCGAKGR